MHRFEPAETAIAVRKYRKIPRLERHGFPRGRFQREPAVDGEDQRRFMARSADRERFYETFDPNGDAVGLGATIALLTDITVVSEKARFADTHVRVGIVAGDGGALIWPLLVGPHRAKEFLMRGHFINGAEAGRIGMVNYAVPPEQVTAKARELAQELADGPTWAIRWSKLAVNKWLKHQANLIMDASLAYEMMTFGTEDQKEAARAFVEKRKAKFQGF